MATNLEQLLTPAELKKIENAEDRLKKKIEEINESWAEGNKHLKKTYRRYLDVIDAAKKAADQGKINADTLKDQSKFYDKLSSDNLSLEEMVGKRKDISKQILNYEKGVGKVNLDVLHSQKSELTASIKSVRMKKIGSKTLSQMDGLLGGMGGKMGGMSKGMKGMGGAATVALIVIQAIVEVIKQFSAKVDKIGASFGVMGTQIGKFQADLLNTEEAAIRVGKTLEDALSVTQTLSSEFGISLALAAESVARDVIDTAVALGISVDESAKLVGSMTRLTGLSEKQAINFSKMVYQLARANDIAPQQVLRDIAASSEMVAGFTREMGSNIGVASVKARQFGNTFQTIAQSAKGILDYQQAIEKALTASAFIGRNIDISSLQRLSMAGDLNAYQEEQLRLLGSETDWLNMDILQRESLANAIGLSLDQAAKMVTKQKEAVGLAKELAKQPGFDELLGTKGISELTRLIQELKAVGADFVNTFGPILFSLVWLVKKTIQTINLALELTGIMAIKRLAEGKAGAWGGGIATSGRALFGMEGGPATRGISYSTGIPLKKGGIAVRPTPSIVGEAGPEAIMPLENMFNMFDNLFEKHMGGITTVGDNIVSLKQDMEGYFGTGGSAAKEFGKASERIRQNEQFG